MSRPSTSQSPVAVALLIGMPMGIAWSVAIAVGQPFIDLETMVRTHGVLNSLAVLAGVLTLRATP